MWEFENKKRYFPDAEGGNVKFALVTLSADSQTAQATDFFFQGDVLSELDEADRHFALSAEDIALINPNTGTCPIFRTKRDASVTLALYRRAGVLWREEDPNGNPWGLRFLRMFDMALDSGLFRTRGELASAAWTLQGNRFVKDNEVMLPLYEAKMANLYNHRSGTYASVAPGDRPHRLPSPTDEQLANPCYVPLPFYWVAQSDVSARLDDVWNRHWLLGWRDVTDARTVARTLIAAVVPRVAVGHKMPIAFASAESEVTAALYANLASLPLDYSARQKIGGLSMTYFVLKQLPVLAPVAFAQACSRNLHERVRDWLLPASSNSHTRRGT